MQGFRSFQCAWRTVQGIETVNMIRKGQIRWLAKDDIAGQVAIHLKAVQPCPRRLINPQATSHGAFDPKLATLPDKVFIVNCLSSQKLGELIGRK
jgi:hypothetical protein